jgi:hypothetical protein
LFVNLFGDRFRHAEYELVNADESSSILILTLKDPQLRSWPQIEFLHIGLGMYQGRNREQGRSFISVMYNLGYQTVLYQSPSGHWWQCSPIVLKLRFLYLIFRNIP